MSFKIRSFVYVIAEDIHFDQSLSLSKNRDPLPKVP